MNGTPMMQHNKQHFENIQQFQSESGRSLVEMLGTLAVMGVLTIGGIAGFNYAMNKQRANATIGYVNELAVLGTGQMLAGGTPKMLDYPDHTPSGYPVGISTDSEKPNVFYVDIKEVPTPICEEMVSRLDGWKMVNDIGFFDGIKDCDASDPANMWFEITASADKGNIPVLHCSQDTDCRALYGTDSKCNTHGTCEVACPSGKVQTPWGCCKAENSFNGGCCIGTIENGQCCRDISIGYDRDAQEIIKKRVCCSPGFFQLSNGSCLSCDDPSAPRLVSYSGFTDACQLCPARTLIGGRYCAPASQACPDGTVRVNNKCFCSLDKPVMGVDETVCHDCAHARGLSTPPFGLPGYTTDTWGAYCNRRAGSGYSFACAQGTVGVSWNEVVRRKVDGVFVDFRCLSNHGICIPCEELDITRLKSRAQCEACGGSWSGSSWDSGSCHKP